jgi:hypothetical protein
MSSAELVSSLLARALFKRAACTARRRSTVRIASLPGLNIFPQDASSVLNGTN